MYFEYLPMHKTFRNNHGPTLVRDRDANPPPIPFLKILEKFSQKKFWGQGTIYTANFWLHPFLSKFKKNIFFIFYSEKQKDWPKFYQNRSTGSRDIDLGEILIYL